MHDFFVAITCPSGQVYQQCGPSCPQTCDTNEDMDCGGGCVEGCFCPSGQVLSNGRCINASNCQGICFVIINYIEQEIKLLSFYKFGIRRISIF